MRLVQPAPMVVNHFTSSYDGNNKVHIVLVLNQSSDLHKIVQLINFNGAIVMVSYCIVQLQVF